MSSALPKHIHSTGDLPKVAWAKGTYVYDVNGKQYIDGSGGPAVYCIGHSNEEVNAAITSQLDRIAHGYRYNFSSDALEELTDIIRQRCGGTLNNMVYVTGGSEAVESCLKLALQYHAARGEMSRRRFIARERSWHGNTLGALSVSGFLERKRAFEGSLLDVSRLSPANAYRPVPGADAETVGEACAKELEDEILRIGAENVCAFIFEPVVGAAGGCVPAPKGYARRVREICDKHGVIMISDEVMCGSGRTGSWRALEEDGVEPDIMSIAKGLAAGYLPLGAAIYNDKVADAIHGTHGAPMTGHTFTAHTACCAAGVAVQKIVARDKLVERVKAKAPQFRAMLAEATKDIEAVGDIRGRGYFQALELVADRKTRRPFEAEKKLFMKIRQQAFDNGLICYPVGGNVDGINGDVVILAPPYNATDAELAEIVEKTAASVRQVLKAEGAA
ncbi:aspartate aminotransferase family protein [Aestuariivirga litoralis]|uniref:Aspartate aminotransferase family protein n=1 Tax=Aestuariivirga litoralis TaxID=2650924 RepID=A0A2W2AU63_9HYPH|nr:aspartate aminotransferase family protein [Aestuariivirga litoralis]PZF77242.1 aspartate aminotransferase family protein [Aestuariivirga litoralis]